MNWFEVLEQKRKLLIGGILVICLAVLAVTARRHNVSFDSFWHLQMGLDWINQGLSPWLDHYSFTFKDQPITSPAYIFDVFLAMLVSQFGLDLGLQLYIFLSFTLVFSLVAFFIRKLGAPVIVYLLTLPVLMVLLQLRTIVRPELISYSLSVIAIMLYYRARKGMSLSNMLPIALLLLLWNNYHSPIIGYIIFFGYFLDQGLLQIQTQAPLRSWLNWLAWGLAVLLVGFITPDFKHPLIELIHFSPEWKDTIQEYTSPIIYRVIHAIYALLVLAVVTLLMLIRKRQVGLLVVSLILIYFATTMARLVTPAGIVILCIFAWMISESKLQAKLQTINRAWTNSFGLIVLGMFILSLYSAVTIARSYMLENKFSGSVFAYDVVDYMNDNNLSGRIFNAYSQGGYILYRLSPDIRVYIDGRTAILYPLEHYYHHANALISSSLLQAEINKYDINFALLENNNNNYALINDTDLLQLHFMGEKYSLFSRDNPNFPLTGTLLANPACWTTEMAEGIAVEQKLAAEILAPDSFLNASFFPVLDEYSKSFNWRLFLDTFKHNKNSPESIQRFIAYQALSRGMNELASELFTGITAFSFSDYLGVALASAHRNEWEIAEQWLDRATRRTSSDRPNDHKVLHALLVNIRQNKGLELFDDEYLEKIAGDKEAGNAAAKYPLPVVSDFCP